MDAKQKKQLSDYFNMLEIYGAVCLRQDEIFEETYPQNIIKLEMDEKSIFHKETVMYKDDVSLKKSELYKLVFPVSLQNLEYFTIVLSIKENKNELRVSCYENTLNSILIKSNIDTALHSIRVWTHQMNGVIII